MKKSRLDQHALATTAKKLEVELRHNQKLSENIKAVRTRVIQEQQRRRRCVQRLATVQNKLEEKENTIAELKEREVTMADLQKESALLGSKRKLKKDLTQAQRRLAHHQSRLKPPKQKMQQQRMLCKTLRSQLEESRRNTKGAIERAAELTLQIDTAQKNS